MGLIVRLQSAPNPGRFHEDYCAFAHRKKQDADDLTKQTQTTAGLTAAC